jgi:hypothetical protein
MVPVKKLHLATSTASSTREYHRAPEETTDLLRGICRVLKEEFPEQAVVILSAIVEVKIS